MPNTVVGRDQTADETNLTGRVKKQKTWFKKEEKVMSLLSGVHYLSGVIILGALVSIAVLAMVVLLGIWTYRDAKLKGLNPILWTAVVLLVPGYIGLILYLIVRTDAKVVTCSACGAEVNGKEQFCSNCGQTLVPVTEISPEREQTMRSQKKIVIGFFSSMAAVVVMVIFMVAFSAIAFVNTGARIVEKVSEPETWKAVEGVLGEVDGALGNLDDLLDEGELHIDVDDGQVRIQGKDGKDLISVDEDGDSVSVDLDLKDLRDVLDKYGIKYDDTLDEEELEKQIEDALEGKTSKKITEEADIR